MERLLNSDVLMEIRGEIDAELEARQNIVDSPSNSLQQLQAKIRAVADKLFVCHFQSGGGGLDNLALINELRELSAVQ